MAEELNLLDLPEVCIAEVLALTTPKDTCRIALMASGLHSASQLDTVWERFLPRDYLDIIHSKGADFFSSFPSKKELYLSLCDNPILIDGDTKALQSFSLEKGSGKKCYMLAARYLDISWIDRPEYWQWISLPISRFSEVAELVNNSNVLEIIGNIKIDKLSTDTPYGIYLVFTTVSGLVGFDSTYPLGTIIGKIRIKGIGGKATTICFHRDEVRKPLIHINVVNRPKKRGDGWSELELGQFLVQKKDEGRELEMSLKDLRYGCWKKGLVIQGIEIRPMHINEFDEFKGWWSKKRVGC